MARYIAKRLLGVIPMLLGISFLTYMVIALGPGGPAAGLVGDMSPKISPEYKEKMIEHYHFNDPMPVQYLHWMKNILKLDFGVSFKDSQPVIGKIARRIGPTLLLSGLSLLFAYLLAIPIGIFSALKQNTLWDRLLSVFVYLGFSIPTYWVALLLMIGLGIHLGWVPVTGLQSIDADEMTLMGKTLDIAHHLVLPLLVTSLTGLASLSRYMRNGMLEVIRQDYIRTARAKGLPENKIVLVHALRNTMIPVITMLGFALPDLISASVIFETIFSYPGLGRLAYEASISRDIFLIMPTVTFAAFLTLLGNIVADVAYAYADPRIRYR